MCYIDTHTVNTLTDTTLTYKAWLCLKPNTVLLQENKSIADMSQTTHLSRKGLHHMITVGVSQITHLT